MKHLSLFYTFLILVIITLVGVSSVSIFGRAWVSFIVLLFAVIKFLLVGFQFMELKHAHRFWKYAFSMYICIVFLLFYFVLF